jgi:hypothetical protein
MECALLFAHMSDPYFGVGRYIRPKDRYRDSGLIKVIGIVCPQQRYSGSRGFASLA